MAEVRCEECGELFIKKPADVKRSPKHFCSKGCVGAFKQKQGLANLYEQAIRQGDCLIWGGHKNRHGYGVKRHKGSPRLAHRVSYEITFGDPGSLHVLHKCDNPACIEPTHLFLGTHQDNMDDMARKDRRHAKLSREDVLAIRRSKESSDVLSRLYGVSARTIRWARSSSSWQQPPPPPK